jgi:hypothetical protein
MWTTLLLPGMAGFCIAILMQTEDAPFYPRKCMG